MPEETQIGIAHWYYWPGHFAVMYVVRAVEPPIENQSGANMHLIIRANCPATQSDVTSLTDIPSCHAFEPFEDTHGGNNLVVTIAVEVFVVSDDLASRDVGAIPPQNLDDGWRARRGLLRLVSPRVF